jgi:cell division protein FtsL
VPSLICKTLNKPKPPQPPILSPKRQLLTLTMQKAILTHLLAAIIAAAITYLALEARDGADIIPVDPKTYRLEERIRIEREQIKPLIDEIEAVKHERDSLLNAKSKIRIIYKSKQNENLNLPDSVAFNLLRDRIGSVLLPDWSASQED